MRITHPILAIAFLLLASTLVIPVYGHALFHWTAHRLEISDIRLFGTNVKQDYHTDESPITGAITVGKPVFINGLVKNQNHTGEHFDYVTQVYDRNGAVQYIYVRYSVAVPFGGQLPIDSSAPLILNETGLYLVKVFAVIGMVRDNAQLASIPRVAGIHVTADDS